ncbi:unnamed protein product [Linum tenue]|uniref:U-box domain-containing protein n=1 Tax=Linum tenue TaxID=586396 RepID=A0AAV0L421_9ROSI|nr:unnamed protein product [Linum tenue]
MVRDDLYITVPSFFRCPISLDVMKSPVSLSTGVTYDRSSIQRWLDSGNNTCPATMQVLETKEFVPNDNLHRLIQIWSNSVRNNSASSASAAEEAESAPLSPDKIQLVVKEIGGEKKESGANCSLDALSKIASFAEESGENRRFLAKMDGFVAMLADLICSDDKELSPPVVEELAVRVLDLVSIEFGDFRELKRLILIPKEKSPNSLPPSLLRVMKQGRSSSSQSRIAAVRIIQSIAIDAESKLALAESDGLLLHLVNSIAPQTDPSLVDACLSCLISISMPKRVKPQLVRLRTIAKLREILKSPSVISASTTEKALKLLESVSSCREGMAELCGDSACVEAVVRKAMKVSDAATEVAVTILWTVCYLFRDQKAADAVIRSNGLTRILLLMQSNCSPAVRQMSTDLLRIFRVNSKSCLSSYDTKTTHIMPF